MTALTIAFGFTVCLIMVCVVVLAVDWLCSLFNRWLTHRERQARRIKNRDLTAHCVTPRIPFDWKERK